MSSNRGVVYTAVMAALFISATAAAQPNTGAAGEVVQTKSGPVSVERLATLSEPWGMTFLPDGRLLVTEKPGRLRLYSDGKLSEPIGGVPKVAYRDQGGLLDVEIDPDFAPIASCISTSPRKRKSSLKWKAISPIRVWARTRT